MQIDPALLAVAGALSTVAGLFYRELVRRAAAAEADAKEWRAMYFQLRAATEVVADGREGKA